VASSLPLSPPLYVQAAAWRGASDAATAYADAFEKRYGYSPVGYSDTLPYDAVTVLLSAIRSAGRRDTDAVITSLEKGAFEVREVPLTVHQAVWEPARRIPRYGDRWGRTAPDRLSRH
jgi:hypothetical protein